MSNIDEINRLTEEYYDGLPDGLGLKPLIRWSTSDLDNLDDILLSLKGKEPSLALPDKTDEEDELAALLRERTERQRTLERQGKVKVRL